MATKASLVYFVCLIFLTCALPTQELSGTGLQTEVRYKTEPVPAFSADKFLTRTKRHLIRSGGCSSGRVLYKRRCITYKRYKQLIEGDYDK